MEDNGHGDNKYGDGDNEHDNNEDDYGDGKNMSIIMMKHDGGDG